MTSRSGGGISGRKLFLRGLKTKQLLSQLVPRQIFQIFPTMRWVMGVALVPGFALVFFGVPLVNPPHWCLKMRIAILTGNVTISHVDLGCYLCSDKPMLMYMRLYNLYAVYPLYMALSMCDYVCVFWKPHSKVVFGLTMGTCGMQMIRMSELKKKEQKLRESRAFFILGMVTWSFRKNLMLFHDVSWFSSILAGSIGNIFYFWGSFPVN